MLTNILTPEIRKVAYAAYAVIGTILGAIQVWISSTTGTEQPSWLLGALAVFGFIGTAIGATAAANASVTRKEDEGDL
jgi:hypothetical protein